MIYHWINPDEIRDIDTDSLVLFGAGKGSEEFIEHLAMRYPKARVIAIADNNGSLQGKTLKGVPIISPDEIQELYFDKIVVTSISGRSAIARQLRQIGYMESKDFLLVGRYPVNHQKYLDTVMEVTDFGIELTGKTCLHIGPGGFLGLEVMLFCMGAERVCAIDKHAFGIHYPDITPRENDYMNIRDILPVSALPSGNDGVSQSRFHSLFVRNSNRLLLDPEKIDYRYPMDVCDLGYPDETFDMILSFAVLEHVQNPVKAVSEMHRVLKPNGHAIHRIVTRDHRSFSAVREFDPFSFRRHSNREWENISRKTFYQNRLLPVEWKHLFIESKHKILRYHIHKATRLAETDANQFHGYFHRFSLNELSEIDCTIFAEKQS